MIKSILIVTENFPNKVELYRGIYVLEQLRIIAKEYDVHVLVPLNYATRSIFKFLSQANDTVIDGINVHYLKYPYFPFERFIPRLNPMARRLYRRFLFFWLLRRSRRLMRDRPFMLVHGQEAMIGDLAIPLGEALYLKKLFTIHTMLDESVRYFGREAMSSVIDNLKKADHLIAVSNLTRNSYKEHIELSKTTVVYNGLNTDKITCDERRSNGTVSLLSVCHLVELKKIDLVLAALRDVKKEHGAAFTYRIVGGGDATPYRKMINAYGLENNVEFVGPVPPEFIGKHYSACDIFVLPSIRESFGIVFLEAMYCGKPVICSSQSGISEIIENGEQGYIVQPDDPGDLKQKLWILIQDRELRLRMGEAGKQLARNFTIEKQTKEILAVYRSLIQA